MSTTRAAAAVMALLRLTHSGAGTDDLLDLLKCGFVDLPRRGIDMLEAQARRKGWRRLAQLPVGEKAAVDSGMAQVLARVHAAVQSCAGARHSADPWPRAQGRRSLWQILQDLREGMQQLGMWEAMLADAAGVQLLQGLALVPGAPDGVGRMARGFEASARAWSVSPAQGLAWLTDRLEDMSFIPPAPDGDPQVVVVPLAQVPLRPFLSVVMPGCDELRLGRLAPVPGWWSDAQREHLAAALAQDEGDNASLPVAARAPTRAARWRRLTHVFNLCMQQPRVLLLWRVDDDGQPLNPSPLLEGWRLSHGRPPAPRPQPWTTHQVSVQALPVPLGPAAPRAPQRWLQGAGEWHASAYRDLRACPYRYFALHMLGLREPAELDDDVAKRELGIWVHASLHAFHLERRDHADGPASGAHALDVQAARLLWHAREKQAELGLDPAAVRPMWPRLRQLAPLYLQWLQAQEHDGWFFAHGEQLLRCEPDPGLRLRGTLDRVDRQEAQGLRRVIDYKLQRRDRVRELVRDPQEDTQLAFYALLMMRGDESQDGGLEAGQPDAGVQAGYLALDEPGAVTLEPHLEVAHTAMLLLDGLRDDVRRLKAGHGLPALGQGVACDWCAARGLCRRDHWPASVQDAQAARGETS